MIIRGSGGNDEVEVGEVRNGKGSGEKASRVVRVSRGGNIMAGEGK